MRARTRDAPRLDNIAKYQNNVCPICWMPLCVGDGVNADKWKAIQVTFKGKPAFSVKEDSRDFSRPVNVFGIHDMAGKATTNYEGCHYVHYNQFGVYVNDNDIWSVGDPGKDRKHPVRCVRVENWPSKDDVFYNALFNISSEGLFYDVFKDGSTTADFLSSVIRNGYNLSAVKKVRDELLTSVFMGCKDCNQKMSISEYIGTLFELVFQIKPPTKKKDAERAESSVEVMMHYIMLNGVLNSNDSHELSADQQVMFEVRDEDKLRTWSLRYIMMWCALQILFCNWKISMNYQGARHHVDYIYLGVMDFYISLWFYTLHALNFVEGRSSAIGFLSFHYYYMSLFPMYQVKKGRGAYNFLNLSSLIFNSQDEIFQWKEHTNISGIKKRIQLIFEKMIQAWQRDVNAFSLCLNAGSLDETFFMKISEINSKKDASFSANLNLDSFVNLMGSYWFWFHFKFITMPRIADACSQYGQSRDLPETARFMWRQWCWNFNERVKSLGVRFQMQLRAQRVASFFIGKN